MNAPQPDPNVKAAAEKAAADAKAAAEKAAAEKAAADKKKADEKAAAEAKKAQEKAAKEAEKKAKADAKAQEKAKREADAKAKADKKAADKAAKEAAKQPKQNDITRPAPDTKTGTVWKLADELSKKRGSPVAIADLMTAGQAAGINDATIRTQYARWRKFHEVAGRVLSDADIRAAKEAEAAKAAAAKAAADAAKAEAAKGGSKPA